MNCTLKTLAALAALAAAVPAAADDARVVLLPKVTVDGAPRDASGLEAVASQALRDAGCRVVDLDAALAGQRAAFSDSVQAGRLPKELSALNADAVESIQVACDPGPKLGTYIVVYSCAMSTRVVRVDSGDVAYTAALPGREVQAVTPLQAVRALLEGEGGKAIAADVQAWRKQGAGRLDLDLVVSGLRDREQAQGLARRLGALPSVASARVVVFNRDYAKLAIGGRGPEARDAVVDLVTRDAELPLQIAYETERVVHAQYDFDRDVARPVTVWWTSPPAPGPRAPEALIEASGADVLAAALRNLGYFQPGEVKRLAGKPPAVPGLGLVVRLARDQGQWLAALELTSGKGRQAVAAGAGRAADPFAALDAGVRDLDGKYRQALARPATRALIGLAKAPPVEAEALGVESFRVGQVFPARLPRYRRDGVGTLVLRNRGARPIAEATVRFSLAAGAGAAPAVASEAKLAALGPGETREIAVKLDALPARPQGAGKYWQLSAAVSYRAGEAWAKVDAYAPLVLEEDNAIDWSEPRSLAAFVDDGDATVRELATRALAFRGGERLFAAHLRDAALVFEALWHAPLAYVADPVKIGFGAELDTVQGPRQTLARGAGDCDDLTVLLASLYEAVGIPTALVVLDGHVLPAVDAGALAGGEIVHGLPASLFLEVDGALFAPVEATAIGGGFAAAWQKGARAVREAKKVTAFRTRDAWRAWPAVALGGGASAVEVARPSAAPWPEVAAAARGAEPVPAWVERLGRAVATGGTVDAAAVPAGERLASAVAAWLGGDPRKGQELASALCQAGQPEGCYDLAAMVLLGDGGEAAPAREGVAVDALSTLPPPVAAMLLDHGVGVGDEASPEAKARRRMEEVLKKARAKLAERRKEGWSEKAATIAPLGGRMGKPADADALASLFFWRPLARR